MNTMYSVSKAGMFRRFDTVTSGMDATYMAAHLRLYLVSEPHDNRDSWPQPTRNAVGLVAMRGLTTALRGCYDGHVLVE